MPWLQVRASAEEKIAWTALAKAAGLSLSNLVRQRLNSDTPIPIPPVNTAARDKHSKPPAKHVVNTNDKRCENCKRKGVPFAPCPECGCSQGSLDLSKFQ